MSYLEKKVTKSSKKNGDTFDLHYKNLHSNVVKKIMLTVDLSLNAIQYAIKEKFSFVISYHGLIVNPVTNFSDVLVDKLSLISKFPINVFVLKESYLQTIFDTIIDKLSLNNAEPFSINNEFGKNFPIGHICYPQLYPNQKEPFQLKDLIQRAKYNFESSHILYIGELKKKIEKIAVVETECANFNVLIKLNKLNVDCLVATGILRQHESIFCKDLKLSVVSLTLFDCVKKTLEKLTNVLSLEFPREEFYLYDSKNPYNLIDFKNNDFFNPELVLKKNNKRV